MLSCSNNLAKISVTHFDEIATMTMNGRYFSLSNKAALAFTLMSSLVLSSCQMFSGYDKIQSADKAEAWAGQIIPVTNEVNIACAGTYHCEIIKIDNTPIISADTHKPVNATLLVPMANTFGLPYVKLTKEQQAQVQAQTIPLTSTKSVKIIALSSSGMAGLTNYYASVKPSKREVHVNFYPEDNMDYVERFALIDEFKEQGTYLLQAYRLKPTQDNGSLLDNASSARLCIDLTRNQKLQRRFCKPLDNANQGEFLEMSLNR